MTDALFSLSSPFQPLVERYFTPEIEQSIRARTFGVRVLPESVLIRELVLSIWRKEQPQNHAPLCAAQRLYINPHGQENAILEGIHQLPDRPFLVLSEHATERLVVPTKTLETHLLRNAIEALVSKSADVISLQPFPGQRYGEVWLPLLHGVGYSHNPYAWCQAIHPEDGALRLVAGYWPTPPSLADDYTRLVPFRNPPLRPEGSADEIRKYSQKKIAVYQERQQTVRHFFLDELPHQAPGFPFDRLMTPDALLHSLAYGQEMNPGEIPTLSLDSILAETAILPCLEASLHRLQDCFEHPMEVEFTGRFSGADIVIDLHDGRLSPSGNAHPAASGEAEMILESKGSVIGHSRSLSIDRILYIVPSAYGKLPLHDRYSIARTVGKLTRMEPKKLLLIAPGRWGTTTPSLGVPVAFAEIKNASVLCEIVSMRDDLIPEASLGTHFFADIVEKDMLYTAYYPGQPGNTLQSDFFENAPNRLETLLPSASAYREVIRVIDFPTASSSKLQVYADAIARTVQMYFLHGTLETK